MKLMIGGACQNKRQAACDIWGIDLNEIIDGEVCGFEEIWNCRAVADFHILIQRMLAEKKNPADLLQKLLVKNPDIIIISDEIGYGIVPMNADLRAWRECTGRICCEIAAHCEKVVRVIAGIPHVIKGE